MRTQKQYEKQLEVDVRRGVDLLIKIEKNWGHHGVFMVIKYWMDNPYRGSGLFHNNQLDKIFNKKSRKNEG